MPKIFQSFKLDLETIAKLARELTPEQLKELSLPQKRETLVREMLKKGYDVLTGSHNYCGLPETILIGGEIGMNHKQDFYELARKLGLTQFSSGECYFPQEKA